VRAYYPPSWIARPMRWMLTILANLAGSRYREGIKATMLPGVGTFFWVPHPPPDLLVHEERHHQQAREMGSLKFAWEYACQVLTHGYWDAPLEKDARQAAGQEP
jgi:hypothetical protein